MNKKILLSGIKPTGRPHLGNYFGAMKQFVALQEKYDSYIFIADIHALNFIQNKKKMSQNILDLALDYLAIGLDPKKVILFKQSDILEHTQLGWIFNTIISTPFLMRAHSFKDAQAKNKLDKFSVGDFVYPNLMAADILLYSPDIVPIGKDQTQHLEFARDYAQKFNHIFGKSFKLPTGMTSKNTSLIIGSDNRKMSKSYHNHLPLFATKKETEKYIMSIPMDSKSIKEKKNPDDYNLYKIYKLFATEKEDQEMSEMFKNGGVGYGEIKKIVTEKINNYLQPVREKRKELAKNPEAVLQILKEGGQKAQKIAEKKMKEIREKVGIEIY